MRVLLPQIHWLLAAVLLLSLGDPAGAQAPLQRMLAHGGVEPSAMLNEPTVSSDGSALLFVSIASNMLPGGSSGSQVYRYRFDTGVLQRISHAPGSNIPGNRDSYAPAASADARVVVYESLAENLLPGSNLHSHIYRVQTDTDSLTRIDSTAQGTASNGDGMTPAISADGRYTAFVSFATDLVPPDGNGFRDLFLHDAVSNTVSILSRNRFGQMADAEVALLNPQSISGDGRYVVFTSSASGMTVAGGNGAAQVYLHDRVAGSNTLLSQGSGGVLGSAWSADPTISPNGRYVAFASTASNLVGAANPGRLYRLDRNTGTLIAVPRPDAASFTPPLSVTPNYCGAPYVSDLGNVLATCYFTPSLQPQVFAWTASNARWRLVSHAAGSPSSYGNNRSGSGVGWSANGQRLAFMSDASDLLPGDTNGSRDIYFEALTPPGLLFGDGFE